MELTPMMRQWHRFKRRYSDAILFFRAGDFYEMFHEDAEIAARELGITLTSRGRERGKPVPLAGIPYHAAESYLVKLVKKGYKVAICEQVEDPRQAKGLVRREVVRVVTPGTLTEAAEDKQSTYLAAVALRGERAGMAYADLSTGEFACGEFAGARAEQEVLDLLASVSPSECLVSSQGEERRVKEALGCFTAVAEELFEHARERLLQHFGVSSLHGFGIEGQELAVSCAGAVLGYLMDTQMGEVSNVTSLRRISAAERMLIDSTTLRHLEVLRNLREGSESRTLVEVMDRTLTPMGGRLLRRWLSSPLTDVGRIRRRLEAVEALYSEQALTEELRSLLKRVGDIERLSSRVVRGCATPRDLAALRRSLEVVPELRRILSELSSELLSEIASDMVPQRELVDTLTKALVDAPPASLKDGGVIRRGYSEELDRLREACTRGREWIAEFERQEKKRTGIASLKVGYNSVIGYYIQVTKPNLHLVPRHYIRRQTLAGAERFVTEELRRMEAEIASAQERAVRLEERLFEELVRECASRFRELQLTARAIARLDVLQSFATVALERGYTMPEVHEGRELVIRAGRHPVVEVYEQNFVPNDAELGEREHLVIVTGPNMAGKSTYLRQVALIVLLAQAGSFVPAEQAKIGVVDRLFTRVGASDDLSSGRSTFMVEMQETANILHNATPRSLVVLDEIGRGTSTYDGLSIAWAVAEHLHRMGVRTLFATHYHQLTELERLPGVSNWHAAVREEGGSVVFLHRVVRGYANRSYGIHVAKLAGMPDEVTARAREVLALLEGREERELRTAKRRRKLAKLLSDPAQQRLALSAPQEEHSAVVRELRKIEPEQLTPLEALQELFRLKRLVES